MLQITADLPALTMEQRQAVAAFILSFPQTSIENIHESEIIPDEKPATIPAFSAASEEDEEQEQSPELAFGGGPVQNVPASPVVTSGPILVPTPTNTATDLDKSGLPWDSRIHAGSRAKTADGNWRKKRGIDDATAAKVEGELKQLMALPSPPVAAVPAPPPAVAAVIAPGTSAPALQSFVTLVGKASAAINNKKLSQEELSAAVQSVGVPSLQMLATRLDLIPPVDAAIDAYLLGR